MKKIIFPKYSKIALIMSGTFLGIWILIKVFENFNIHLYLFGVGAEEINPIITVLSVVLFISAIGLLLYKNTKHKDFVVLATAIPSFLILSYLIFFSLLSMNGTYFEYTSDDAKHDIVVNERDFLLAGYGDIYEKTSFFTMKRVGGYTTDDGFRPFSNNAFYFVWNEKDFELHYAFFDRNDEEYRIEKMEYAK